MTPPIATYRLQLNAEFTMFDAAAVAPYCAALGVSHLYLSPVLQSAPGSTHGYDGVDPTRIDESRGGEAGFAALCDACAKVGLRLVLDIVPNHLDISSGENSWWRSVLEKGQESEWAEAFDIDWSEDEGEMDAVLAPVLGERLPRVIAKRDIQLERSGEDVHLRYFDHTFPLSPESVAEIVESAMRERDPTPRGSVLAPVSVGETLTHDPQLMRAVDERLEAISDSPELLREMLSKQHYKLAYWGRAAKELNYRRFFDINNLVGVRVEREAVFRAVHERVLELARTGFVDGLRVDHPDGLRDPAGYFRRLAAAAPEQWLVAEKILEREETIREDWPVAGTTGYDFLNQALGILIEREAEGALTALYREFAGCRDECADIIFETKWAAARQLLMADLLRLVRLVDRIAQGRPELRAPHGATADAIALLAACMPVYRTYIVPERGVIAPEDEELVEAAYEAACARRPDLAPQPLEALRDLLLLRIRPLADEAEAAPEDEFVARFQQYSAPAMAKGVEDTAFYRYNRFVALNEVGGDPALFGGTLRNFHAFHRERAERWPATMNATATHDTKRGEDVRARLAVLTETPLEWAAAVKRWAEWNDELRRSGGAEISRNTEYLMYQIMVGAWPIDQARLEEYMLKAAREAKQETSWVQPDAEYEESLRSFVRGVCGNEEFVRDLNAFVGGVRRAGRMNGLVQTVLKIMCPGVPDVYQGSELWDLNLVDPDNRRPVDFGRRARMLERFGEMSPEGVWRTLDDEDDPGTAKMWLMWRSLRVRREHRRAFEAGSTYRELAARGEQAERVVAFVRSSQDDEAHVVVIASRLNLRSQGWGEAGVELPETVHGGAWRDVLSRTSHVAGAARLDDLLGDAPVSVLVAERR